MEQRALKYIQIRHWDYWWAVYQCGTLKSSDLSAAEFSVTDTENEEQLFFHFDFYNLSGLGTIIREKEFIEPDHPDYPAFLDGAESLKERKKEYFIGGLYYRCFIPDLAFCNQPLTPEHTLLDLEAPPPVPYYAVLFLAEERPLIPEVLNEWMVRLSRPLFGKAYSFVMPHIPTREEALVSWEQEKGQCF